MAVIAQEDTFVEDADGIRRLVAKGSAIPQYLGLRSEGEEVETRSLARPVVDEEASKSHAERTGSEQPEPYDARAAAEDSSAARAAKSARGGRGGGSTTDAGQRKPGQGQRDAQTSGGE